MRGAPSIVSGNMGHISRFGGFLPFALVFMAANSGARDNDPWADVPRVVSAGSTSVLSTLSVTCKLISTGKPRRAHCVLVEAALSVVRSPQEIAADLSAIDDPRNATDIAKQVAATCKEAAWRRISADTAQQVRDLEARQEAACMASDARASRELLKEYIRTIEAKTCKLGSSLNEEDYVQSDADTWTSASIGKGICTVSQVDTLWRTKGETWWNFRGITTVPPNVNPACVISPLLTEAWEWRTSRVIKLPCEFIEP
jgi:hypothetical protein